MFKIVNMQYWFFDNFSKKSTCRLSVTIGAEVSYLWVRGCRGQSTPSTFTENIQNFENGKNIVHMWHDQADWAGSW